MKKKYTVKKTANFFNDSFLNLFKLISVLIFKWILFILFFECTPYFSRQFSLLFLCVFTNRVSSNNHFILLPYTLSKYIYKNNHVHRQRHRDGERERKRENKSPFAICTVRNTRRGEQNTIWMFVCRTRSKNVAHMDAESDWNEKDKYIIILKCGNTYLHSVAQQRQT